MGRVAHHSLRADGNTDARIPGQQEEEDPDSNWQLFCKKVVHHEEVVAEKRPSCTEASEVQVE